jgi:SNF2 family DNA or RNA helicase
MQLPQPKRPRRMTPSKSSTIISAKLTNHSGDDHDYDDSQTEPDTDTLPGPIKITKMAHSTTKSKPEAEYLDSGSDTEPDSEPDSAVRPIFLSLLTQRHILAQLAPRPNLPLPSGTSRLGPLILSTTPAIQVPGIINTYLREYQRDGVRFFWDRYREERGGLLGDDMGLVCLIFL